MSIKLVLLNYLVRKSQCPDIFFTDFTIGTLIRQKKNKLKFSKVFEKYH